MGCDIHARIDDIQPRDKGWSMLLEFTFLPRDYNWFCVLGGVRCWHEPKCAARPWQGRGLPERPFGWEDDPARNWDHSSSWVTTDELRAALAAYQPRTGPPQPEMWPAVLRFMEALEADGRKVRLVFAFDN